MTKNKVLPILTLVLGMVLGFVGGLQICKHQVDKLVELSYTHELKARLSVLSDLRKGNTVSGFNTLENGLNTNIIGLEECIRSGSSNSTEAHQLLLEAKKYRIQYPFKSISSQMDDRVRIIFSKLD